MAKYFYQDIDTSGLGGDYDILYQAFANRLRDRPRGLSFRQIHFQIGTPLGLTKDETRDILEKSVEAGYVQVR